MNKASGAILIGVGDGTFRPGTNFSSTAVTQLALGDFNNDGKPDIVGGTPTTVSTFLGNGDGTFQVPKTFSKWFNVDGAILVADLNNDGNADLMVSNSEPFVSFGNGDGTFQAPFIGGDGNSFAMALADFNADGFLDVAAFGQYTLTSLGPFTPTIQGYTALGPAISLTAVLPDFSLAPNYTVIPASLAGNSGTDWVYIVPGDASLFVSLGFAAPKMSLASSTVSGQSGYGQLITLTVTFSPPSTTGTVVFYDGTTPIGQATIVNGTATLVTRALPSGPQQLTAHFLGNPGQASGVSNTLTQSVVPNLSNGLIAAGTFATGVAPIAVGTGDFNRDGITDLAVANSGDTTISILIGIGDGTFRPAIPVTSGADPVALTIYDANGDGVLDIAVANGGDDSVSILLGNGDGTFQLYKNFPGPYATTAIIAADFTGDGIADLAVGGFYANIDVFPGAGDGTFGTPLLTESVNGLESLAAGDFAKKGSLDLAVAGLPIDPPNEGQLQVRIGDNSGTFGTQYRPYTVIGPSDVTATDVNGDGAPDLVFAIYGLLDTGQFGDVEVILNLNNPYNNSEPLGPVKSFSAGMDPLLLVTGDMSGAGKQDIAVTNYDGVSVLRGNGDGTFQPPVQYTTSSSYAVAMGDFNGDGVVDLAVTNVYDNNVEILLGVPGKCSYAITPPGGIAVDSNGGAVSLNVQPNGLACAWTAAATSPWFQIGQTGGTGDGSVVVTVQPNTTGADRTDPFKSLGRHLR